MLKILHDPRYPGLLELLELSVVTKLLLRAKLRGFRS